LNNIEAASPSELLSVGQVIRPHGLKGLLRIKAYAGSEASFLEADTVLLKTVSGEICKCRMTSVTPHKNIFLMGVEEAGSADEAEAYRGAEILVQKGSLSREDDAYFWYELLGLRVYLETGECLGAISRILTTGSNDIYVVKEGEKETYIPAVHEVVKEIDLKNEKMIISPMEGLLDLNEI
jgi:16S rRNA processing protein RimM